MEGSPEWQVCILIPAHNEEELLPRCVESVIGCIRETPGAAAKVDVVIAVDSSKDRSFEIAKRLLKNHGSVIKTAAGNVGQTRRRAAEVALGRYRGALNRCWLANTDADSVVPSDWLAAQLSLASRGVEAVAGIVSVDHFKGHDEFVESKFHSSYTVSPDGSHPHVHGANLGVRADAYLRAGGWGNLQTAEDWDLWNRLARAGARRTSSTAVAVLTSGRRVGRAPNGFAAALAAHNSAALP